MLKIFNTLSHRKEIFRPINSKEVRMYVCGPTVNDVPHLGHARQQIVFDVFRRYLRFLGYKVKFVSNITDIDDKIINKARENNEDIKRLTERNLKIHLENYKKIGVEKPDFQPRASEYIREMIDLIKTLEKKGYTYVIENDGVYYDVSKFSNYGKLSNLKKEKLIKGFRKSTSEKKRNKEDFVLWKFSKEGEPWWDSPWGKGRPGWHIECSAMSKAILGLPFDIHGGGQDLIFPHHEDEIAQSEAAYEKRVANYWVHNGMVNIEGIKMSKSLGNFKTIEELLKEYSGELIRYFVISTHYRKPIEFSKKNLDNAKNSLNRLKKICLDLKNDSSKNEEYLKEFKESMDDDLNTPNALQVLWKLVRDKNAKGKFLTVKKIDEVFCLKLLKKEIIRIPEEIKKLVMEREKARKEKNWELADSIRKKIFDRGFKIDDSENGPKISRI